MSVRCQGDGYFLFPIEHKGHLSLFYTLHPSSVVLLSCEGDLICGDTRRYSGTGPFCRSSTRRMCENSQSNSQLRGEVRPLLVVLIVFIVTVNNHRTLKEKSRGKVRSDSGITETGGFRSSHFSKKWQNHSGDIFSAHDERAKLRSSSCFSCVTMCYNIMQQTAESRVTELSGVSH